MPGFGWGPFSTRPYSVTYSSVLPAAIAANAALNGIVFAVDIIPVSGSPIYAATLEFATRDTDSRPNQPYAGTVEKALTFHRAIIDGTKIGGMSSGYSEIVLNNASGDYDVYGNSLDGARVIVRMGSIGSSWDSFVVIYDGLSDGVATADEDSLTLHLYDDNKRLEIPAQPNVYGGTGGIDGDANVAGKRKPVMLGYCRNVPVVLIDAINLVYQYSDGQSFTFTPDGNIGVYDRSVVLVANSPQDYVNYAALIAATITPGRYATCAASSLIRLGVKPDGVVTVTAQGAVNNGLVAGSVSGSWLSNTASLVHYLITISSANIVVDAGSVITTAAAQPAVVGYWIGPDDNKTLRQAIDELMYGIMGWAGFRRDRTFDMGLLTLPISGPSGDYTGMDFYAIRQVPLPSSIAPPPWRIRAAYGNNFTIQSDIDATIDAATQTLRKNPYSIAASTDAVTTALIQAAHPQTAQDPEVWPSWFLGSSPATTFCNSLLTLFGGASRTLIEIDLPADAYSLNIGNIIRVADDRYGLSGGKLLTIVSINDNTSEEQATIQGFG